MDKRNENPGNEQEFRLSDRFAEDMKKLHRASAAVPPEIDRAILAEASQKLTRPRKHFHILRWIGPAAAAAAIIIFVSVAANKENAMSQKVNSAKVSTDIDSNGKVDILDAFKLARYIQSENQPDIKWDINGDGLVNQGDVDSVALAAVSLNKGA